jgi:hypothetical protein
MSREITRKILDAIENDELDTFGVLLACLKWMSEADVRAMAKANALFEETEDES